MQDLLFDPELFQVFLESEKTKESDWLKIKEYIEYIESLD